MSQKLRDLIRHVRACKTAAEERAVIAKESALMRTAFKDQEKQYRHRNVAKVLFIHMLGYPSHFGQMECVKLIASPYFAEKRMGYLGLILLLTDNEDVLTLVTNSVKNDLNSPNHFVVGLALTAVGNIASPDMARDLVMDIDKHLRGENDYLRKKAALACIRVFTKLPELVEDFVESVQSLLRSKNHGVLLTGVELITQVMQLEHANIQLFGDLVPKLVKKLRSLLSMGYSSEYDVSGIADPFLQAAILRLLRLLGKESSDASEAMNDVLAQVATNTETAKTAGNAVLYECVQTIMTIESDNGLRVLAINILGRFLLNRDNNIRYVALNTLSKVVADDAAAVQRHTNTIVECLKDPDTSIRQRALELIYALVNDSNIQLLAREMLNYLVIAPREQKPSLCSRIADAVDRYAPSNRWQVDTLITMLSIAGSNLPDERIGHSLIMLIQRDEEMHAYVVHKLFAALSDDLTQLALVHVGLWCIGEYGHLLLLDAPSNEQSLPGTSAVSESQVVALLSDVLHHHAATEVTKAYALTSMLKLTTRFRESMQVERLEELLEAYRSSSIVELQQRSIEYSSLLAPDWNSLRPDVLANMPPMDITKLRSRQSRVLPADRLNDSLLNTEDKPEPPKAPQESSLLDLDDIFGGGASTSNTPAPAPPASNDLLADLFASDSNPPPAPAPANGSSSDELFGLFEQERPTVRGYDQHGIIIDIEVEKNANGEEGLTHLHAKITNESESSVEDLVFQAAFPKYVTLLAMEPPSGHALPAKSQGGSISQTVKIKNSMAGQKPVMMRVKLVFSKDGQRTEDIATIDSFPQDI